MTDEALNTSKNTEILKMAVGIVSAYVRNNPVPASQVPEVISTVYSSLADIVGAEDGAPVTRAKPAVSIKKSITPDYLICLEDGKQLKMLKRHLRAVYGLSPGEYRAKWGLPPDYPMVAPNYAKQRSNFAKQIGLGRKKGESPGNHHG